MSRILFELTAFVSLYCAAFGVPVQLDNSNFEDVDLNSTDIENINLVASSPYQIYAGTKEYTVVAFIKVNWFAAQQLCSTHGLTLASINSPAESTKLQQYLFENGLLGERFWTSGNILSRQNRWFWMSNGNAVAYTNWARNEPNNYFGQEYCLEINPNGEWNDYNCNYPLYFICENRCPLTSYDVPVYPQGYYNK